MTRRFSALFLAGCLAVSAPRAAAQDDETARAQVLAALEEALPGTLLNDPYDVSWNVHGKGHRSKMIKAEGAPGGVAYQVRVKEAKRNPWDISVQGPVSKGVSAGDVVLVAFWARAEKGAPASIVARVAETVEPYAAAAEGDATLSENWQIHYVSGRAARDWAPGELALSFNVATGRQTLAFGQYYVMNMGPDADAASMPSGAVDP